MTVFRTCLEGEVCVCDDPVDVDEGDDCALCREGGGVEEAVHEEVDDLLLGHPRRIVDGHTRILCVCVCVCVWEGGRRMCERGRERKREADTYTHTHTHTHTVRGKRLSSNLFAYTFGFGCPCPSLTMKCRARATLLWTR
jgi:hypothetical protein